MTLIGQKNEVNTVRVRRLGSVCYKETLEKMQAFTDGRDESTLDEIWLLEHKPVFTQGQAGKAEHLLNTGDIPVVQADRGGQVTYHGPGQLVIYILVDLRRMGLGVRGLVTIIESSLISFLASLGVAAKAKKLAPGVYVNETKVAQLGLRIRRGCSFHGLSLNVAMDLEPFSRINPCGHEGLEVTSIEKLLGASVNIQAVTKGISAELIARLGYNTTIKE
jgi:lipoyl(octanoyl) transferase